MLAVKLNPPHKTSTRPMPSDSAAAPADVQPSKKSFPGDRKDRNAAHSRVYRLLKKNRTKALADEVEALKSEGDAIGAACTLSSPGMALPQMPSLLIDAAQLTGATPAADATDDDDGAGDIVQTTRRERKAIAAKAARRRARERLASLEYNANALRKWVALLRSLVASAGTEPLSSSDDSADDVTLCSSPASMPPKKRHRSEPPAFVVEDVD